MSWKHGRWAVEHALPLGVIDRAEPGRHVGVGDTLATGSSVSLTHRVSGARHLGVGAADLAQVMRVRLGQEVARGAVLARTGRRFTRAVTSPLDGRIEHLSAEGDFYIAPILQRWIVRSTMAGVVTGVSGSAVTVEGDAWMLSGIAAYGPDAVGELALGVRGSEEELAPHRIDVRLRDRILVGGARIAAEAVTRAHACGVAGLVAGAVPAGGLRVVYGDDVAAAGGATREDRPTVLCLVGFGTGPLPPAVFGPLAALAGSLATIHVASARLFVFAGPDAVRAPAEPYALALAPDFSGVRPAALPAADGPPAVNVLPFDAPR